MEKNTKNFLRKILPIIFLLFLTTSVKGCDSAVELGSPFPFAENHKNTFSFELIPLLIDITFWGIIGNILFLFRKSLTKIINSSFWYVWIFVLANDFIVRGVPAFLFYYEEVNLSFSLPVISIFLAFIYKFLGLNFLFEDMFPLFYFIHTFITSLILWGILHLIIFSITKIRKKYFTKKK